MHLSSRSLSIILAVVMLYRLWPNRDGLVSIAIAMVAPLVLIWFPEQIDEYTFGTWDKGNRIDKHTPPVMIVMFGWVILLLEASIVFDPNWVMRFLYGPWAKMPAAAPILTLRLQLRPPQAGDAAMIFGRYAANAEVTRWVGWPRHERISDTDAFLKFSAAEWGRWPAGPLLIESRADGRLLGSTGLAFETPVQASTGYVLARDAQGFGYASEALRAVVQLARGLAVTRLYALCHPSNSASIRVLERCDFACEGLLPTRHVFPNLGSEPQDVASYVYAAPRIF